MKAIIRWLSIAVAFALAIFPVAGVSGASSSRDSQRSASHRASRAKVRTVRYSPKASSSPTASKSKSTKKNRKRRRRRRRRRYRSRRVHLPKAPSRSRTREIQSALARGGYYDANPNGRWDAKTVAAVKRFQSANNLDATGKLDARTLQKLGLGSDIAGVSAPKPIVPASCCEAPASADPPATSAASTQALSGNSASAGHSPTTSSQKSSPGPKSSSGAGSTSHSNIATADPPR
jgi:hypothetical protein